MTQLDATRGSEVTLLTPAEAGKRLRCSKDKVRRLVKRGELRGHFDPYLRIRSDDVDAYIDRHTQ